jgi:23S rRNA (guanosine2251-2'-O)-methyltransferase
MERLKSNPKSIKRIYVAQDHAEFSFLRRKAHEWGIPFFSVPKPKMLKMTRDINAQGILIEIEQFQYVPYAELIDQALPQNLTPFFLDGLMDPQNLGGIIRSLACLGGFAVVLPTHDSVAVTEAVLRVASGGDNFVPIARVSNLHQAIVTAKKAGFWMAGAVVGSGDDLAQAKLPFPLALVVGSEQKGIREIIKKQLDLVLSIPMRQRGLCLNVAHAASLFAYEISRQKEHKKFSYEEKAN